MRDMKAKIADALYRLFAERLHIEVPSADTDLIETGLLDSLRLVELTFPGFLAFINGLLWNLLNLSIVLWLLRRPGARFARA